MAGRIGERSENSTGARPQVLVVDDDGEILDLIVDVLSPAYRVCIAEDLQTAASLSTELEFDLLIADLYVPWVDGAGFINKIRDQRRDDNPSIMVISTYPRPPRLLGENEIAASLPKPFSLDELEQTVGAIISARDERARSEQANRR